MALGELYARYSLLEAQDGNSFCLTAPFSSSLSSPRFQGNTDSIAVGVVTRYSPVRGRCTRNENTHEHDLCVCVFRCMAVSKTGSFNKATRKCKVQSIFLTSSFFTFRLLGKSFCILRVRCFAAFINWNIHNGSY